MSRQVYLIRREIGRDYRTSRHKRIYQMNRRDELKAQGLCINNANHGAATDGVRCFNCAVVHKATR